MPKLDVQKLLKIMHQNYKQTCTACRIIKSQYILHKKANVVVSVNIVGVYTPTEYLQCWRLAATPGKILADFDFQFWQIKITRNRNHWGRLRASDGLSKLRIGDV